MRPPRKGGERASPERSVASTDLRPECASQLLQVNGRARIADSEPHGACAVGEAVILLHPPLPSAGVSTRMERGRQQNDGLADGAGTGG